MNSDILTHNKYLDLQTQEFFWATHQKPITVKPTYNDRWDM